MTVSKEGLEKVSDKKDNIIEIILIILLLGFAHGVDLRYFV
jgi:hypothetical protein